MATITGTEGSDFLSGGDADDTISGLGGNDQLSGGNGNDTLNGGSGNDVLTGGAGTDILTGGTGADTFQDTAAGLNGDTITDFQPGDRIQITDLPLQNSNIHITASTITYNGGSINIGNGLGPGRLVLRSIATTGVEIRLQQAAHNDFNGDGISDVLWRHDNGNVTDWLGQANGSFVGNTDAAWNNSSTSWHIAGTGDFNGDGRVDILWRSDGGEITDWLGKANGGFQGNIANADNSVSADWQIVGTGDFNGDGRTDVLWRGSDGTVTDWLGQANGSFVGNIANAHSNVGSNWHVAGTGDFNGDGVDDILWRNDNGDVTDWLGQPDGSFAGNTNAAWNNSSTSWHIVGVGDFNGDGRADILWRSDSGEITDWLGKADGGFQGNIANADSNVSSSWHVVEVGDFNGDAIDDVLWQNDDGTVTNWLGQSNGGFVGNIGNAHSNVDSTWHVQPTEVFL